MTRFWLKAPRVVVTCWGASYQHCIMVDVLGATLMGLSGTTWDTNTPLTWANMNHMGHHATLWTLNPPDVTSSVGKRFPFSGGLPGGRLFAGGLRPAAFGQTFIEQ